MLLLLLMMDTFPKPDWHCGCNVVWRMLFALWRNIIDTLNVRSFVIRSTPASVDSFYTEMCISNSDLAFNNCTEPAPSGCM